MQRRERRRFMCRLFKAAHRFPQRISNLFMYKCLNYIWRLCATALSYICFGLGGLVLWIVVFPALSLFVRDRQRLSIAARWVIRQTFRAFVGLMHRLGIFTYETHGLDRLNRHGLLILANHPTLIDVVFLISFTARADCVVKAGLATNPFTRGPVTAAGFIHNNAGPELVSDSVASLRAGNNLIIFPEGTRTPMDGTLAKLQRGASNVAVRGEVDVTPVLIQCNPLMLVKGVPWWKIPGNRPHFRIEVREDLPIASLTGPCASDALAVRRLTERLTDYFITEIHSGPGHTNARTRNQGTHHQFPCVGEHNGQRY
ncbi:lysophospholipid acyltransferase family protein [Verminephrobacter aporrectodeae]|nr:1-acyl-sn-glycerol-3-phosphate acyltransferase [Verminephrobacter aporrectodeae]